jgi:hypothetical protein
VIVTDSLKHRNGGVRKRGRIEWSIAAMREQWLA